VLANLYGNDILVKAKSRNNAGRRNAREQEKSYGIGKVYGTGKWVED
jgi:hypothetical protein